MSRRGSPTIETVVVVLLVFVVVRAATMLHVGLPPLALAPPLTRHPWTLVTSVYGHWGLGHLISNALGLLVLGLLVERRTTRLRFHGFVLLTGALAGATEVLFGQLTGGLPPRVLGISGAVFALFGYLLAGNVVSQRVLDRIQLSERTQILVGLAIAVGLTLVTAGPEVALAGHATGLLLGLAAGRLRLLDAGRNAPDPRATGTPER